MQSFSSDLQLAITAAKAAGEIIKAGYGNIQKIDNKDNGTIVTNVDKESEETIINILQKKSNYAIYSEEIGNIEGKNGLWVIDPLDGTTNFARGIPLFCVSIALMKGNNIELGVIYNPTLDELFFAEKGKGCFLNNKKNYVSNKSGINKSIIIANQGHIKEIRERYLKIVQRLYKVCYFRRFGTTALELCYIAKGGADAFMCSGDELYDYAAGLIIVEEAGGKVTDWKGNTWDNTNSFILATNRKIHDEIVVEIKDLQ